MVEPSGTKVRHKLGRWQRRWQISQSGSFLGRLLAFIVLGVAMVISLFVLIILLLLSWLLIPVMMYRARRRATAMQGSFNHQFRQNQADVLEGELLSEQDSDRDVNREK